MTENQLKVLDTMLRMPEQQLKQAMSTILRKRYDTVIETKDYIMALGDIPVALVAHMDTVWLDNSTKEIYFDKEKQVMFAPSGLGADDRAGVMAIWQIVVSSGYRPTVILTLGEEIGGKGAEHLAKDYPKPPVEINYMIELDRANRNDAVFYYCDSKDFKRYICDFDFEEQEGSFTDISFLMRPWRICGVNLSCGYVDEHNYCEHLHIDWLEETIEKVIIMLQSKSHKFKFHEVKSKYVRGN